MLLHHKIIQIFFALHCLITLSWCFSDPDAGPSASSSQANGDRFKIEGRAIVPGIKSQEWVSSSRVLVEGEEYVGFLRYVLKCHPTTLILEHNCVSDEANVSLLA